MRQYVAVILVTNDGSVLAQHRDNIPNIMAPNLWAAVGGLQEKEDKDLKHGAARELFEETDYKLDPQELELLIQDVYTAETNVRVERNIFWAKYDGEQEIKCNEGQAIRFISTDEFETLNFYSTHRRFLELAVLKAS